MNGELTPEQRRFAARPSSGATRRRLVTTGGLGGLLALAASSQARARGTEGDSGWDKVGEDGDTEETPESFTGPLFGYTVSWDPESWVYSVGSDPELGYDYDFIGLSGVESFALGQVEHHDAPFDSLAEAAGSALVHYLARYAMSADDVEVVDQWANEVAVGVLYYYLGYDDTPYTYVEYAPAADAEVWSTSYVQIRASTFFADTAPGLFEGIWVDDEPLFRGADVDDIIEAIADDME